MKFHLKIPLNLVIAKENLQGWIAGYAMSKFFSLRIPPGKMKKAQHSLE